MVIGQCRVGDKWLEDMITDHSFLHVSRIDTVCDEIGIRVESLPIISAAVHEPQISVEESPESLCAEASSKLGAVWGKGMVRLCVAGETEDQMGSWVDGITV